MISYEQISKANSEITMLNLKGKDYAMVPERVNAFRKIFPDGFINTEIISHDGTVVLMQAKAGYYKDGVPVVLGTGYAQEVKGKGLVNGTSYIENCETSAVGRALGMMGLGINGGGICSAEELVNAITAQSQEKKAADLPKEKKEQNATVSKGATVPATEISNPVLNYLAQCRKELQETRQISREDNAKLFSVQTKALINAGLAPDKPFPDYTMEEAIKLVADMYTKFDPEGTVIKS